LLAASNSKPPEYTSRVRQGSIERRLAEVTARLIKAREELAIAEEQLEVFDDSADEARIRSLVSETPIANHDWNEAQRHADAQRRGRDLLRGRVAELEHTQDELLSQLVG
jgi:hypothetical protein